MSADSDDDVYPCEKHERSIEELERRIGMLAVLRDSTTKEIAVMQEIIKRLEHSLFGNGQPGALAKLEEADKSLSKRVVGLETKWWIALGAIGAMQILIGWGVLSLKALLPQLPH